jgi:ATP-dependent protease HslVU (ClpYQ) ATPase subunit
MERLIYIVCFFLVSCSPSKRLTRLITKYPGLVQTTDTTIYFETKSVDTSFIFTNNSNVDTFYVAKTNTTIYRHLDTIWFKSEPIRDSITITKQIIKVDQAKDQKGNERLYNILMLILVLICILSLYLNKPK